VGKSAPEPPDPRETSAASTSTNVGTAIANSMMNNANQVTPDGTISYDQTSTYTWNDPYTGKSYQIPRFTATTQLSDAQQAIKGQTDAAQLNLGTLANNQSAFLNDYMAKPFDGSNEATEARLFELGRKRLDPMYAEQQDALDAKLANQGIMIGSQAYDAAQRNQYQARNDGYNSLLLQGRGQAFGEAQATRNQPINEITALLSGSQVSQPQAAGFNQSTIPTTDVAGNINTHYQQQLANWQQKQAGTQSILGGLFGLGSSFIMSDRRLKTDIKPVGKTKDGQTIYQYRYITGGPVQMGLMAQEVEKKNPDAVGEFGGFKAVDYGKALENA